jgi:hypothetical protein
MIYNNTPYKTQANNSLHITWIQLTFWFKYDMLSI